LFDHNNEIMNDTLIEYNIVPSKKNSRDDSLIYQNYKAITYRRKEILMKKRQQIFFVVYNLAYFAILICILL